MTDDEFIKRLQELDALGKDGLPPMRELLRPSGQLSRLIALAARGVTRAKRAQPKTVSAFLPEEFPDAAAREDAIAHWRKNRRPDLEADIERQIDKFRFHFENTRRPSWPRTWATWYRNALDYTQPPRTGALFATVAFEQTNAAGWTSRLSVFNGEDRDCPAGTWSDKWGPRPGCPGCRVPPEAEKMFEARKVG